MREFSNVALVPSLAPTFSFSEHFLGIIPKKLLFSTPYMLLHESFLPHHSFSEIKRETLVCV